MGCVWPLRLLMIVAAVSAFSHINCPSSPAEPHPVCAMEVTFETSCEKIQEVIENRVKAQASGKWHDPRDKNGMYYIDNSTSTEISMHRHGSVPFDVTDKQLFSFHDDGPDKCVVSACSASQIPAVMDDNNNFCSIHNLYCTNPKCHPLSSIDYHYDERIEECPQHDTNDCYQGDNGV
jgi:hypothetical protein